MATRPPSPGRVTSKIRNDAHLPVPNSFRILAPVRMTERDEVKRSADGHHVAFKSQFADAEISTSKPSHPNPSSPQASPSPPPAPTTQLTASTPSASTSSSPKTISTTPNFTALQSALGNLVVGTRYGIRQHVPFPDVLEVASDRVKERQEMVKGVF
jgi:hypothetical protein